MTIVLGRGGRRGGGCLPRWLAPAGHTVGNTQSTGQEAATASARWRSARRHRLRNQTRRPAASQHTRTLYAQPASSQPAGQASKRQPGPAVASAAQRARRTHRRGRLYDVYVIQYCMVRASTEQRGKSGREVGFSGDMDSPSPHPAPSYRACPKKKKESTLRVRFLPTQYS